ncbi:MAG: type II secretion system protein J [bacterium]
MPVIMTGRRFGSQRGLTLVELLLAVVIMAGVAGVFYIILSSGLDLWESGTAHSAADQEVRLAMERISRELRASRNSAGQITIGGGNTTIDFPLDNDNDGAYEVTVSYYLTGSELRRQENGNPAAGDLMASDVSSISFNTLQGFDLIGISMAVSRPREGKKGVGSVTMRTAVAPRNN